VNSVVPLTPDQLQQLRTLIADAGREVFPGLCVPLSEINARLLNRTILDLGLEALPREVRGELAHTTAMSPKLIAASAMRSFLFQNEERNRLAEDRLREQVWPFLGKVCSLGEGEARFIWEMMLEQRRLVRSTPADLLLQLAELCFEKTDGSSILYAELLLFSLHDSYRTFTAQETYAWGRLLEALAAIPEEQRVDLRSKILIPPSRLVSSAKARGPVGFLQLNPRLLARVEGAVLVVAQALRDYLDALETDENNYYRRSELVGESEPIPSSDELWEAARHAQVGSTPDDARLDRFLQAARHYDTYDTLNRKNALPAALAAMFALEEADSSNAEISLLPAVIDHLKRWSAYQICHEYRNGPPLFEESVCDKINTDLLLSQVVSSWHRLCRCPHELLRLCDAISAIGVYKAWLDKFQAWLDEARVGEPPPYGAELLPLWLLKLRGLRLHGRSSPQWRKANQCSIERLGFTVCRVNLADYWHTDARLVLQVLEGARQLAVARRESETRGPWDPELLRIARQIFVRLEQIDDSAVRRALLGYFYPVLTAIAAWHTHYSDPLEGLCLFEMSKSRWLLDHLTLHDRTLAIGSRDDLPTRDLKNRLSERLTPRLSRDSVTSLLEVDDGWLAECRTTNPALARLVETSWLNPSRLLDSIPRGAAVLAYHVEQDPADFPRIDLAGLEHPWRSEEPGPDAILWMFLIVAGHCHVLACQAPPWSVFALVRDLDESLHSAPDGSVRFNRDPGTVARAERTLKHLAALLVHPWGERLPVDHRFPLLIVPCGELYRLPWAALPLPDDRRLIDPATIGVMPSLGATLWAGSVDSRWPSPLRTTVFCPTTGLSGPHLRLSDPFLTRLRSPPFVIVPDGQATPSSAMETLDTSEAIVFLGHGRREPTPALQLTRDAVYPTGLLTIPDLGRLSPGGSRPRVVVLGTCWSGLETPYAAEQVDGLTSALLLKGVQAVVSPPGSRPVSVDLLERVTCRLGDVLNTPGSLAGLARTIRSVQRSLRDTLQRQLSGLTASLHPLHWAGITFHGIPWEPPRTPR
jgi:hypothetical protein